MSNVETKSSSPVFTKQDFLNPKSSYRVQPFWFWNGEMEEHEIEHQIKEMADKGIGGFFICPRQGLTIPYLSEEWFEKVQFAVDTAKRFQLEVWLYDEYPYPSGIAGGEVTLEHPDAKQYQLVHKVVAVEGGSSCSLDLPWGRILSAKAVPVNPSTGKKSWDQAYDIEDFIGNYQAEQVFQKTGLTAYNQKRYFTYQTRKKLNWKAPEGKWEVHCFLEVEIDDFKYYGTFVDPCHEEAIKTFIDLTHNRYAKKLSEEFGQTVKGMFTDETGLLGKIPWSTQLLNFFKQTKGYDLKDYLHALIDDQTKEAAKVRYDYFQSIHLLLRKTYHKQIHDWCEEHGIQYVAEVPSVRMTSQAYSHVPGGDSAHEKLGRSLQWILDEYGTSFRANPKLVSSLGNQLGRERILIECFHSIGWSMTLQDAKWMLDRLGAFGINFYNFHAFFYTLDGLKKHDAPPSQFLQNPYWEHFRLLGDYAGRLGYVMSCGKPMRNVAVLDPTTSLWTHMGNPFHSFHYSGDNVEEERRLNKLKKDWSSICQQLTFHYKDYDHLDPELLAEAVVKNGMIKIGNAAYSVLILPPLSNLEIKAWEKIEEFIDQDGVVIANGLLPFEQIQDEFQKDEILNIFGLEKQSETLYFSDENQSIEAEQWLKGERNAYFIPKMKNHHQTLLTLLDDFLHEKIQFHSGDESNSFLVEKRILQDESILVFISNQEGGKHKASLYYHPIDDGNDYKFQALELETGRIDMLHAEGEEESWKVSLQFSPYQSHLIHIIPTSKEIEETTNKKHDQFVWNVKANDTWRMKPLQDNVLRIDTFELKIQDSQESQWAGSSSEVQVKTFIDQCADLTKHPQLPLAFHQVFGTPMKMAIKYPLSCTYEKIFEIEDLPGHCLLLIDKEAISGKYKISINDQAVSYFKNQFVYDHRNQTCDITSLLKKGQNTLRIEVTLFHDADGVVDPLYLLGDFGVTFDSNARPIMAKINEQMLATIQHGPFPLHPYYAGTTLLKRNEQLDNIPVTQQFTFQLSELDKNFHDCLEVKVNGYTLGVRAWTPYQWEGPTSILNHGENEIEVKVTNTLIGLLEGKSFDYDTHTLLNVNEME
ncbi:MAG TPA: glycosyl hydrolase [Metabacillus sp.]|nr:glycosyl hydrolase [Metabacillus sp.]